MYFLNPNEYVSYFVQFSETLSQSNTAYFNYKLIIFSEQSKLNYLLILVENLDSIFKSRQRKTDSYELVIKFDFSYFNLNIKVSFQKANVSVK